MSSANKSSFPDDRLLITAYTLLERNNMPVSDTVECELRDTLDDMAQCAVDEINLDREFTKLLKDHALTLSESDQMKLLHWLAMYIHDGLVMHRGLPLDVDPKFDRCLAYVAERMKLADWRKRYDAMQTELDAMLDCHVSSFILNDDDDLTDTIGAP